jgi:hypothetical protein
VAAGAIAENRRAVRSLKCGAEYAVVKRQDAFSLDAASRQPPVAPKRKSRRWMRTTVAVGALAAAGASRLPDLWEWQQSRLVERLATLASDSDPVVSRQAFARLSSMGGAAMPVMVRVAASSGGLARDARTLIADRLIAWESAAGAAGDAEMLAEQLAALATNLETQKTAFDRAGWSWLQSVSRRVVRLTDRLPPLDAAGTLQVCQRIISLPQPRGASEFSLNGPSVAALSDGPSAEGAAAEPLGRRSEDDAVVELTPIAEPHLPIAVKPSEAAEPRQADNASAARPLAELWLLPAESAELPAASQRELIAPSDDAIAPARPAVQPAPVEIPSPDEVERSVRRLRELTDRQLLASLATAPRFDAAAIREVLRTRGYSPQALKLIERFSQAPVADRRQALERTGSLPASDARSLLRWFVGDDDAEIRLQALSMLATTSDPRLEAIARERAVEDADPRVSELASRIIRGELK